MRLPAVPGPRDVIALVERLGDLTEQVLAAVPRVTALLGDMEKLVAASGDMMERMEGTRLEAEGVTRRTETTRARSDLMLDEFAVLQARMVMLLDRLQPSLVTLQPTLERLAESMDPDEVDAMIAMIDQMPLIARHLEEDVIPVLGTLGSVAPDLHDLLDTSKELNEMLAKLPGMGRIKRRVDAQQAAEQSSHQSAHQRTQLPG